VPPDHDDIATSPAVSPPAAGGGDVREPTPTRSRRLAKELRQWLEVLVVAVVVVTFGATTVGIEGSSMEPSLHDGERAVVPRYETWLVRAGIGAWQRGDVVYFRAPGDRPASLLERLTGGPYLIKRVIALGGDVIEVRRGSLVVNGDAAAEPYLVGGNDGATSFGPTPVPEGHLYVMGDNRSPLGSRDSRVFGTVPVENVGGRAAWVVWPLVRRDASGALALNVRPVAAP
jgi:signal peptidase I